tara:strand:- start:1665 stop:1934 length:270 start_codon:yes stop_codon:yes gene_type:complete
MILSKTTMNMAEKRNIDLWFHEESTQLMVSLLDCDHDAHVNYKVSPDGLFFDQAHGYDSEDWPNWISDEKQLRALLPLMAAEMKEQEGE